MSTEASPDFYADIMPLNLSPTQVAFNARGDGTFNLPFQEQIDFFRQKLNLPTEHYDDILAAAHDRAFVVAGAAKADLLNDLRGSVDKAIADGKSLGAFRKEFAAIVQKHGWEGWTGSDTQAGRDWRTRVIYSTNIQTSYNAGRYTQLKDPELLKSRPNWKYIHNDTVSHPRPLHQSWSGTVLPHGDPWWDTHFTPNGYGCRCRITAVGPEAYQGHPAPDDGTYEKVDRNGEVHTLPKGVDYGFDYAPGKSNLEKIVGFQQQKQEALPWQLARANVKELVHSSIFSDFFAGKLHGEFPVAVLPAADRALLGSETATVLLSQHSLAAHLVAHPEIGLTDYLNVQEILETGEVYRQGEERLVYLMLDGVLYRAALKRTLDGQKNYFLTLFRTDEKAANKEVRNRLERIR
ncbi:MAG: phage minor head protein [Methylobacter sp.]|uniref:Phage minor head protein n=1 Tax=Candidatus Methylobacter titanis TaxID=3053457 RepID=A0AA43Q693_9GAMM|nr:phage minor head protein [Candidatus Methylobacter titanis]